MFGIGKHNSLIKLLANQVARQGAMIDGFRTDIANLTTANNIIAKRIITMSAEVLASLADLKARVTAESDVNKSAIATMTNLSALLTAALANEAGDDDATVLANIKEIADGIDADKQALADAITANTPASTPTQAGGSDTPQA